MNSYHGKCLGRLKPNLPDLMVNGGHSNVKSRFVYSSGKVVVRGLGVLKPEKQLESLTE